MAEERTERATPKRRQDARRQGDVPRSAELSAAAELLGAIAFLQWYAGQAAAALTEQMRGTFSGVTAADLTPLALQRLSWEAGMVFARVVGPLVAVVVALGIGASIAQTGPVFALAALKPDFGRLSPARGLRRIVSRRGAFETLKALVKLAIVVALTYPVLRNQIAHFASLTGADPVTIVGAVGRTLSAVGLRAAGAFFILALADYAFQRWDYERRLRMTRQELREELRQTEGDPELKARLRRLQQQLARGRMMHAVPQATVVVTNPTHLAVAIRYDLRTMPAPVVVAKGSGAVAERIKAIAREHAIPVVENKPLAQALYRSVEVGMEIPLALYEAVADVIAYVYRLRMRPA
ncbi:MAG: flagellar biosynthesis protein FlhB [Sphaerobacter sp.]|nr:flagellar biosynthesis protein FlhB [Sphaerobacter sp.]